MKRYQVKFNSTILAYIDLKGDKFSFSYTDFVKKDKIKPLPNFPDKRKSYSHKEIVNFLWSRTQVKKVDSLDELIKLAKSVGHSSIEIEQVQ
jgi:hypothetical protein